MSLTYIVKTGNGYLFPFGSGISYTDAPEHAGHFASAEDAEVTAELFGYLEGHYEVIPVALTARRSFRQFLREMDA